MALNHRRGKTIDQRPKALKSRDTFGHWEMDTVVSGQGKSRECLLVLTERKTRLEIVRRMIDKRSASTVAVLNDFVRFLRQLRRITALNFWTATEYQSPFPANAGRTIIIVIRTAVVNVEAMKIKTGSYGVGYQRVRTYHLIQISRSGIYRIGVTIIRARCSAACQRGKCWRENMIIRRDWYDLIACFFCMG